MTTTTVSDHEAQRFRHLSTRQLVDVLLVFWPRPQIPLHAIERTFDPLRRELRRREARGFDNPFDSPYPEVTW
jgi:hypothetical protein